MSTTAIAGQWVNYLSPDWIESLDRTVFLTRCRTGTVTRGELKTFIVQQHFYSRHFTQYLCALLSNMSIESDRLELTENLLEEIGFDEEGAKPHAAIYREMMTKMGIQIERETILPSTQRLVQTMFECCRSFDPLIGLSALCLGAEAIVPHLYGQIVQGLTANHEPEENLEFFRIHIEEDDGHAITMRNIIEREIAKDPLQTSLMRMTALRVIQARIGFFEGLTQAISPVIHKGDKNVQLQLEGFRQDQSYH